MASIPTHPSNQADRHTAVPLALWSIPPTNESRAGALSVRRPGGLPAELVARIVSEYSDPGNVVVDPVGGVLVASVPANAATPAASRPRLPMPASLSQISRRSTRPSRPINSHNPSSKSSLRRVGSIRPVMNREWAATITSTGNKPVDPSSNRIPFGGNHKSHCAASPASQTSRSAGSGRRYAGRSRRTWSRNQLIDPVQPTRSAITVAGICGCSDNNG